MDTFDNVYTDLGGHGLAADELQALMCYREVRAYWMCFNDFNEPEDYDIEQEILGSFYDEYPEEMLLKAIEQYKSEQKS